MFRVFSKKQVFNNQEIENGPEMNMENELKDLSLDFVQFQNKLNNFVKVVSRHCTALAEMQSSMENVEMEMKHIVPNRNEIPAEMDHGVQFQQALNEFVKLKLTPMQATLDTFPDTKVLMEQCASLEGPVHRYSEKIVQMKSQKYSPQSAKMLRNIGKLNDAKEKLEAHNRKVSAKVNSVLSTYDDSYLQKVAEELLKLNGTGYKIFLLADQVDTWIQLGVHTSANLHHIMSQQEKEQKGGQNPLDNQNDKMEQPPSSKRGDTLEAEQIQIMMDDANNNASETRMTFKKLFKHTSGTRAHAVHQTSKASIANGLDMKDCVALPSGISLEEWISVHVIDFYNEIGVLYDMLSEVCTKERCPEMTAGPCYSYLWADNDKYKAPTSVSAPDYVHYLMEWVSAQIDDEKLFSINFENSTDIPESLIPCSKVILKRMFRVYAHIYHSHIDDFMDLKADEHLNFSFKRFIYFVLEYDLVHSKELNALRRTICKITEC